MQDRRWLRGGLQQRACGFSGKSSSMSIYGKEWEEVKGAGSGTRPPENAEDFPGSCMEAPCGNLGPKHKIRCAPILF